MGRVDKNTLKKWFKRGAKPNEDQFESLIDSMIHKDEGIALEQMPELIEALDEKAPAEHGHGNYLDKTNPNLEEGEAEVLKKALNIKDGAEVIDEIVPEEVDKAVNSQAVMNWSIQKINTMADLRKTVGKFEGQVVELIQYYDDVPAPAVKYKWTTKQGVDDGGSCVVITGEGSWVAQIEGKVFPENFGAKPDGSDNSDIYANMINSLPEGTIIEFNSKGIYKGYFNSKKAFKIVTNGAKFINVKNSELNGRPSEFRNMFRFTKDKETLEVLNYFPEYGQDYIDVNNGSIYNVGDLLIIKDEAVRYSDSFANINNELQEVKSVQGNRVYLTDIIRSRYVFNKVTILRIVNPFEEIIFEDVNFESSEQITEFPLFISGARKVSISNFKSKGVSSSAMSIRDSNNITISSVSCSDAVNRTVGGNGYGVNVRNCRNVNVTDIYGKSMRRLVDFQSSYVCNISKVRAYDSIYGEVVLCHNTYGGCFTVDDVVQFGGVQCVVVASQGIGDLTVSIDNINHKFRDSVISNVKHYRSVESYLNTYEGYRANFNETITIGHAIENVTIEKVVNIFFGNTSLIEDASGIYTIMLKQNIYGNCKIRDVYSNLSFSTISLQGVTTSNINTIKDLLYAKTPVYVEDVSADDVRNAVVSLGISKNTSLKNIVKKSGSGNHVVRTTTFSDVLITEKIELDNVYSLDGNNLALRVDKPTSFKGIKGFFIKTQTLSKVAQYSNFNITASDICYGKINIDFLASGNINSHATAFIQQPNILGEEFELIITDNGSVLDSSKHLIIQNTNLNIIGETKLYVDKSYKFKSLLVNDKLMWRITLLDVSQDASSAVKGLVRQSTAVANVNTTIPQQLITYKFTDLQEAENAVNNLVSVVNILLNNDSNLTNTLNAKLAADRNSEQQAIQ